MFIKEDKWSAFGHYTVGSDPTPLYNLTLALEKNLHSPTNYVKFHFHDEVFKAAQPTVEPSESLLELYCQRVKQLREKYDYLVLFYSGGADSHNILKCFEHTDTKLDEIISFVDSSYKSKDSKISSEVYKVAIPEVEAYKDLYPDCKFTLIEIREIQEKLFRDTSFKFDLYQDAVYHIVPFSVMHFYALHYVDRFRDLHDQGKKVGVIQGIDKVKLEHSQGKWAFRFNDFSSHFGHKHYFRDFATYDEFFYWTPDLPQITIKQAHVTARYMDYLDSVSAETPYRNNQHSNVIRRKSGTKTNWEYANHIIYPFWQQGTFSTGKTFESFISNGRDDTLSRTHDEILRGYKSAMYKKLVLAKNANRHLTPSVLNGSDDKQSVIGMIPFATDLIYIE